MERLTIRDVARAAGVSAASASRALGGGAAVSPELTQRIRAAAARLGYLPNLAARALATNRSSMIGVLLESLPDVAMAEILSACEARLAAGGYALALGLAGREALPAAEAVLGLGARALILGGYGISSVVREAASRRRVPCVGLGRSVDTEGVAQLDIGQGDGAALATRYLESLGHRVFAVIAASGDEMISAARRVVGKTSRVIDLVPSASTMAAARAAIKPFLGGADAPTALICQTDAIAFAALRECIGCRIEVPGRLSIVGFGDTELSRQTCPSLSTVRVEGSELGRRLAEMVLAQLEGRIASFPAPPVKLIIRDSTGPANRE